MTRPATPAHHDGTITVSKPAQTPREHTVKRLLAAAIIAAAASAPAALASAQPRSTSQQQTEFDAPIDLLRAIETADAGLRTFQARLHYIRTFALAGDEQVREGYLYLDMGEPDTETPKRRFAVRFDTLTVGSRRRNETQRFIFDGLYLTEIIEEDKQFNKRQIARPGDRFDPLAIGEGPFPVPIGQPAADVAARFDTALRPAAEGLEGDGRKRALRAYADFHGFQQLLLVPRPGTELEEDFEEIRIWYDVRTENYLLPAIVKTTDTAGDQSLIVLTRPLVNETTPDEAFDIRIPDTTEGWQINISNRPPVKTEQVDEAREDTAGN